MIDIKINNRLKELPSYYRDFILSGFVSEAAETLGTEANLSASQINVFSNCMMLYLLFFIEKDEVRELLINDSVSEVVAENIIEAFDLSLPEFLRQSQSNFVPPFKNEVVEYETVLNALPNKSSVPIYQSSQADLLHPVTQTAPTPNTPSSEPRWETQQ